MNKKRLQIQHLNTKMTALAPLEKIPLPPTGWIKAIRLTLGITLEQLGNKLSITRQSVKEIEAREKSGGVTIKSLRQVAQALDMHFVYGFVPKDGTLEDLIDRKAREIATKIVLRTSNTMKLEDQENSKQRIQQAIQERTESIKAEMPKILWD